MPAIQYEEAKAVRVNMITGSKKGSDDAMYKIGCALVMLMECMTKAAATEVSGECDSSLENEEPGMELGTFSILFIIMVAVFAAGYLLGRQYVPAAMVESLGTQAEETCPGPERSNPSSQCPAAEKFENLNFQVPGDESTWTLTRMS